MSIHCESANEQINEFLETERKRRRRGDVVLEVDEERFKDWRQGVEESEVRVEVLFVCINSRIIMRPEYIRLECIENEFGENESEVGKRTQIW